MKVCAAAVLVALGVVTPAPPAAAQDVDRALEAAAARSRVPLRMLRAVAYVESRYNPRAVSPVGALGLLQLLPVVLRTYHVRDPFDARQNAAAGASFLQHLHRRFGRWRPALAAYCWGPAKVRAAGGRWPTPVRRYVGRVCARAGAC